MHITIALRNLRPGALWSIDGDDYGGLIWNEENDLPAPTEQEILEEIERLKQQYQYDEYQRKRKNEYPSFEQQLDILYHQGYDGWKEEINKIKDKYPKPEES